MRNCRSEMAELKCAVRDLVRERYFEAFGKVQALHKVDLEIYHGEIVELVGDNRAGKSSGAYSADKGEICVDGQRVEVHNPGDALRLNLATAYQELALVDNCDVASHIYLGIEPTRGIVVNRRMMLADAEAVLQSLRIDIP